MQGMKHMMSLRGNNMILFCNLKQIEYSNDAYSKSYQSLLLDHGAMYT